MPREGQNPKRWSTTKPATPTVVGATIVHIPDLRGYWSDALRVLELCLDSYAATAGGAPLVVMDNASCAEVQRRLFQRAQEGSIHQLILSRENVGKVGGWNTLFGATTSEVVAYFDSDVLFLRGWLEESLRVLEAFESAGMVTAQPIAGGDLSKLWTAGKAMSLSDVSVRQGVLIPDEYLRSHLAGLGAPPEEYERRMQDRNDVLLSKNGVQAYATASHFQFLAPRKILRELFPATATRLLGDDLQFDVAMAELGAWRLSTDRYLVHHLGNRVPDLSAELPWCEERQDWESEPSRRQAERGTPSLLVRLARRGLVRRLLKRAGAAIYEILARSR